MVISSGNGLPAVNRAMELLRGASDPLDAVVAGVTLVEDDPDDMSVGYGGLPNERGVVELDASVMHGPTHKAGSVAALRNIRNPAQVALAVLKRTDHVMLVGEGALEFARAHGFTEQNLLTDRARRAWLRWKENHSDRDDWIPAEVPDEGRSNLSRNLWRHSTLPVFASRQESTPVIPSVNTLPSATTGEDLGPLPCFRAVGSISYETS